MPRPLVVQDRNPHSYLADFQAEYPLYSKSTALVNYLKSIQIFEVHNLPQSIEKLWIDLYERGYFEYEDVLHIQNWIQALLDVGYEFPKTTLETVNVPKFDYDFPSINSNLQRG